MRFLLILIFFLILLNCGDRDKKETFFHLEKYFQNLPKEEKENESLYNKEILLLEIETNYFQQNYYKTLEVLEKSYTVFTESDGGDEFDYYFGSIIERLIKTDRSNFIKFLEKKVRQQKILYKSKILTSIEKISNTTSSNDMSNGNNTLTFLTNYELLYNHYHLKNVYFSRYNYDLEKKALTQIYPYLLTPLGSISNIIESKNNISNLENIYQWTIRYSDAAFLTQLIMDLQYINTNWLSVLSSSNIKLSQKNQKLKNRWQAITNLLTLYQDRVENEIIDEEKYYFGYTNLLVVRNRTHPIRSRNLLTLAGWHPYQIVQEGFIGEDGNKWLRICFKNKKHENYFGFIEESNHRNSISLALTPNEKAMYESYYQKKYFLTLKSITKFLLNDNTTVGNNTNMEDSKQHHFINQFKKELHYVLFNQTLNEIATRATSLNNPYTDYVKKYPRYFRANEENNLLIVNQQILLALLKDFPESKMTMYFEGW